ncbi:MAG TPA: hypothetical protein DD761_04845 [Cyanobacteria bacterium UBA11691]|nr:hypothetical protein [Cyanobacteria bacterium UBA11691]
MPDWTLNLNREELKNIANGACIYGSGGGGAATLIDPLIEVILEVAKQKKATTLEVVDLNTLNDNAGIAIPAAAGSPASAEDRDFAGKLTKEALKAFNELKDKEEQHTEKKITHVLAVEVGVINTLIPIYVAVESGLPLIDGAGGLRSFPILPLSSFASQNIPVSPLVLASPEKTITYTIESSDTTPGAEAAAAEAPMRGILSTPDFGNMAGIAFWTMTGLDAKKATVRCTLTKAKELGQVLQEAKDSGIDPVDAVLGQMTGSRKLLEKGRLDYAENSTSGSLDYLKVFFKKVKAENAKDTEQETYVRIYAVNENLIAWNDQNTSPIAIGPALMCYLTCDGDVFTNADLETIKDKDIAIIGAPPQNLQKSPSGYIEYVIDCYLSILHGIGYGGAYADIEDLPDPEGSTSATIRGLPRKRFSEYSKRQVMSWRG